MPAKDGISSPQKTPASAGVTVAVAARRMPDLADIRDEYLFFDDKDDRYRLIIELGRELEPMELALKTTATKVQGCAAEVWAYPTVNDNGTLHFQADSTSGITKGVIALIITMIQDRSPAEILSVDIEGQLQPFEVQKHLSSNRTQGIPNMIKLIRATAQRYAT